MMFDSWATSIYGAGSCEFGPIFAWTAEPSIQALLQPIFFVSCKLCKIEWWRLSQTPASCQSWSLRQQVILLLQPISCGRYSHGIPVLRTKMIPVKAVRSGMRGWPPLGVGSCFGKSGSTWPRSSLLTRFLGICFTTTSILQHIPLFVRFC